MTSARVQQTRPRTVALDALSHPLSVGAVGLLLLNDHILKSAMPGLVTGKLSDFAGLFFSPFLAIFVLSFLPVRRPEMTGFLGTAVWFLGIKLVPAIARTTESMFPWPSRITVDWTDLIALVSLLPAYQLWHHLNTHPISDSRRRKVRNALTLGVASVATLATSPVEPPSVGGLNVVNDDVYAYVGDVRLFIYHSPDHGVTWREIEEAEELPDGFPVVGSRGEWPYVWWDNGVLTDTPAGCTVEDPAECYRRRVSLSDFEVSENGGVSWKTLQMDGLPELYEEEVPFIYLDWIWCQGGTTSCQRSGGDPRIQVVDGYFTLHEGLLQRSFDGGLTWESGWLPGLDRLPEGLEELSLVRCEPHRVSVCYRPLVVERTWLRSTDGGITWSPTASEPRGLAGGEIVGVVCVTGNQCFRGMSFDGPPSRLVIDGEVVRSPKGWRAGRIEETNDGGSSWQQSWTVSPRYGGHHSVPWLAVPVDLAGVGEPKTLLVSLGRDGMLRRTPDGSWETISVGPVSSLTLPLIPWDGPRVALAWSMSLALVVFGTYLATKPDAANRSRLAGSIVIAIGVLMMLIYLIQTANHPYGIAYSLIGEVFFSGVPLLTLAVASLWLLRRSGPAELKRALMRSLLIGAIPLLLSLPWLLPRILDSRIRGI